MNFPSKRRLLLLGLAASLAAPLLRNLFLVATMTMEGIVGNDYAAVDAGGGGGGGDADLDDARYVVTTTNLGWNSPSARDHVRFLSSSEFFEAVRSHPRYDGAAWTDLEADANANNASDAADPDGGRRRDGRDRPIIAFADFETCYDLNYPVYGNYKDWRQNVDPHHPVPGNYQGYQAGTCGRIKAAANGPALARHPDSRLVILDCMPLNKLHWRKRCRDPETYAGGSKVVVAYLAAGRKWLRPDFDVGYPPWALRPAVLDAAQREALRSCDGSDGDGDGGGGDYGGRKYLYSFQGRGGFGREALLAFENEAGFLVNVTTRHGWDPTLRSDNGTSAGAPPGGEYTGDPAIAEKFLANDYAGVLSSSAFVGAPRGDVLFSYRFSEALSAGAVPVVYADDWLPPFSERVVNWTECCAVFVPEGEMGRTREILGAISGEERCRMRRRALEVWDEYVGSRTGVVRGLVDSAVATWGRNRTEVGR